MTSLSFDSLILLRGSHKTREDGMCIMEAAAWMAGEPHSDCPKCVDVTLATFARALNDACWPTDIDRTKALLPIVPLLVGTAGKMDLERLRWLFADSAIRDFVPRAFDIAADVLARHKLTDHATKLRKHAKELREPSQVTIDSRHVTIDKALRALSAARNAAEAADIACAAAYSSAFYASSASYASDAAAAASDATLSILQSAADLLRRTCTECRQ